MKYSKQSATDKRQIINSPHQTINPHTNACLLRTWRDQITKNLIKNSKNKVTNTDKQHTEQEINLNTTNNT